MNTKAPIWNEYIAHYTRPTLAIVPKATQAASGEPPAILCAVRLAPRTYYYADGRQVTREQFSHACYEYVRTDGDWIVIRNMHGELRRSVNDVEFAGITYPRTKAA